MTRFRIGSFIQFDCNLKDPFPYFLLCLAIDRFLLSYGRGIPDGKASFPTAIGTFADDSSTLCVFSLARHIYIRFHHPVCQRSRLYQIHHLSRNASASVRPAAGSTATGMVMTMLCAAERETGVTGLTPTGCRCPAARWKQLTFQIGQRGYSEL